jgi:hypothetical protein
MIGRNSTNLLEVHTAKYWVGGIHPKVWLIILPYLHV